MYVLVGDVDNNNYVNMLDLQRVSNAFQRTGPPCWIPEDVDNNGVVNMGDLDIVAHCMGASFETAITNVYPQKTAVGQGCLTSIDVTVKNQGTGELTDINVTTYANGTPIQTLTIPSLAAGQQTTVTFTWNTSGWVKGNYNVSAYAQPNPAEANITDNTLFDGYVSIGIPGDVDSNGLVNMLDLYLVALNYGKNAPYSTPQTANCDIDWNGIINMLDLYIAATHYGQTDP
jgi:hypothetical protein